MAINYSVFPFSDFLLFFAVIIIYMPRATVNMLTAALASALTLVALYSGANSLSIAICKTNREIIASAKFTLRRARVVISPFLFDLYILTIAITIL